MHTIDYIQKLKEAKFSDEQITAIATIATDLEDKQKNETATKQDLRELELRLKNELIRWILGTGIAGVVAIAGLLKLMVH
jgi:hypothetical protein